MTGTHKQIRMDSTVGWWSCMFVTVNADCGALQRTQERPHALPCERTREKSWAYHAAVQKRLAHTKTDKSAVCVKVQIRLCDASDRLLMCRI